MKFSVALAEKAKHLDSSGRLGGIRDQFVRPEGWIYFDSNSVGPSPKAAKDAAIGLVDDWAQLRRCGWSQRDWIDMPEKIGDAIAPFIGAGKGEVIACDNTTVNLYKAVTHAIEVQAGRKVLLTQAHNFPTDLHVLQGIVHASSGKYEIRYVSSEDEAIAAFDETVALASFSHVDYKSSIRWDMARVNQAAHDKGAMTLWDVSHGAGAIPIDVKASNADYIVGCGYKYMCLGPGGAAYMYVHRDLVNRAWPSLCGWMGHADIYAFADNFDPHPGMKRFISGTPLVGANELSATTAAIFQQIDPEELWAEHRSLSEFMIEALEGECGELGVEVSSPRDYDNRGGHISFRSHGAGHVVEALIDAKVVSSFRKPDNIRYGISPLAVTHTDIYDAALRLKKILIEETWRDPKYANVSV